MYIFLGRYVSSDKIPANGAYVGMAPPGDVGSWQRECKVIWIFYSSIQSYLAKEHVCHLLFQEIRFTLENGAS